MFYKIRRGPAWPRRIWFVLGVLIVLIVAGVIISRKVYFDDLRPVSKSQATQLVTISSGTSTQGIADQLQRDHLIKSAWAFVLYVHSKGAVNLQAGTYALAPNLSTSQVVGILSSGRVESGLVTILPGRRIDQIRADLINAGFSPASVDSALNPANYADLPVIADKPPAVNTLEGLLWPDSFEKQPSTDPSVIIRESLVEMGQHLTPAIQQSLAAEGMSVYQGLTLASIVQQEVSKPADQAQVAQVFFSRLKNNMVLGSDVSAYYGSVAAGQAPSLTYDSPYNTLIHNGLPPSPISTISQSALNSVAHPAGTNWLYFVAGDNGVTYFSTDYQTHVQQTQAYCHKLCSATP